MPCLNERHTLSICIQKATQFFSDFGVIGEVLVADNGSTDGSQQISLAAGARVIQVDARVCGAALMEKMGQVRFNKSQLSMAKPRA